jgi:hypothetical protein
MNPKNFSGDLSTLDLTGVFETLGYSVTEASPNKYWVSCPWSDQHSATGRSDTVIWQSGGSWPEFHCSHNHCADRKLDAVIEWTESLRPGIIDEHCSHEWVRGESKAKGRCVRAKKQASKPEPPKIVTPGEAIQCTERFLKGYRTCEADLYHASGIYPGENWRADSILLLEHLYSPDEFVCICTEYGEARKKDGSIKAVPKGAGQTRTAAEWVKRIRDKGTPESLAGAWIRLNPVTALGRGTGGAHTDADVTAWRYMLVESDALPVDLQIALYAKLALPVAMLCTSGGASVHAWIRLDSRSEQDFRAEVDFILSRLAPFGVDRKNKNPSRYGRLPGALRSIGAQLALREDDSGQQRLLYFKPQPPEGGLFPCP